MRITILLALLALMLGGSEIRWYKSYAHAQSDAKKAHKPLMLFLTQPGCGVCRFMEEEVFTDKKVRDYANAHYVCGKFYIEDPDLPEEYHVEVSPVITFIDPDSGEIIEQIVGGKKPSYFYDTLEEVIDANPQFKSGADK